MNKKLIIILLMTLLLLAACGNNKEIKESVDAAMTTDIESTENDTTNELQYEETSELVSAEKVTFDFEDITGCEIMNGSNGNTLDIADEKTLEEIKKQFQNSTWKLEKTLYGADGCSLVFNFYIGSRSNCKYSIDVNGKYGIKYNECLYKTEEYDEEQWQSFRDAWEKEVDK